jgi:hypothetical protein
VIVHNQGAAEAADSVTSVEFINPVSGPVTTLTQPTKGLVVGEKFQHDFDIPEGCYPSGGQGCNFRITVDSSMPPNVDESNEANNTAQGFCPGIAP